VVTARLRLAVSKKPKMSEGNNVEDVASKQNHEVRFEGHGIGDADTAEGQARRAEEAADLEPPEDPIEEVED
jgi:hypothetical protein